MIADRKSRIPDDRKKSRFHIIGDNHKQSQSSLLPLFGQLKCQNYRRFVLAGKSHQNNMADIEEEILIITVTVVNAHISCNFLHKFLVTNVTLFNASHVYNK